MKNCYAALGVIHQIWPPVPGRFKDYIAMPRPNLYQSLHTTVIHAGQPFEVQIRTQEMHRIAEQGVAAHWKYKDGHAVSQADDQRIVWMRQLIEWVQEMEEPSEFLSTLRVDLYPEEVYTFSPKGRVVVLPRGATPVDFAYAIHTEVGHQCSGAKVNGAMVPLRHALANGDVVEILTQKGHEPSRDWLSFVHTSRARSKIRQWINLHERAQATDVGRRLLEKEARQANITLKKISDEDWQRVASEYGCGRIEDLHADLGYGKWSARQVLAKATGAAARRAERGQAAEDCFDRQADAGNERWRDRRPRPRRLDGLSLEMLQSDSRRRYHRLRYARPRHRRAQQKLPQRQNLLYEIERRIPVEWAGTTQATFPVRLRIFTEDRPGILASITSAISDTGANIRTFESGGEALHARMEVALDVHDRKQLERILSRSSAFPVSSTSSASIMSSGMPPKVPSRILRRTARPSSLFCLAATLLFFAAGCKHMQPLDTKPLDAAGVSYDSIKKLVALNVTPEEISEIAKMRSAGFSDDGCVAIVQIYHQRNKPFDAGETVAGLAQASVGEDTILELAKNGPARPRRRRITGDAARGTFRCDHP